MCESGVRLKGYSVHVAACDVWEAINRHAAPVSSPYNAHPILPALQAATSKAVGASSKPAAAKAQGAAAAGASGASSSGKKRRRGSRRAKAAGQAMDTVSVTAQLP